MKSQDHVSIKQALIHYQATLPAQTYIYGTQVNISVGKCFCLKIYLEK